MDTRMEGFLNPASVALIGVPKATGMGAFNYLENLIRFGYKGKVFPVNPKLDTILGFKAYPDVMALPEKPDLAVVTVGRERVLDVVRGCGERGIRRAIVVTQGFADADTRGKELQRELTKMAHAFGIRIVGPNTLGIVNHLAPFSSSFVDIPRDEEPWPVSVVCQSGLFHVGPESFIGKVGKGIDIGDACDIGFTECLEYFGEDPETRVIVIHMEGIRDEKQFLKIAAQVSRRKPVLALKTGRSEAGKKMALSHTGSMVGEHEVYKAAFKKAGLLDVKDSEELMDAVKALLFLSPMKGKRLGLISFTGGGAVIMADACQVHQMEIAEISSEELSPLQALAPDWFKISNPVDIWPPIMWSGCDKAIDAVLKLMQESDNVDGIIFILPAFGSPLHADINPEKNLKERPDKNTKPVVACPCGDNREEIAKRLEEETRAVVYPSITRAVRALSLLRKYHVLSKEDRPPVKEIPSVGQKKEMLLGQGALRLLEERGIPVLPYEVVLDDQDAVRAGDRLGYPLAVKLISPSATHKTERGVVVLDIRGVEGLRRAIEEMRERALREKILINGFLLQPMAKGVELIMGIKRDPQFGPVITFGMGGIYTEVLKDFTLGIVPINKGEAMEMVDGLRGRAILEGVRGQPGVDKDCLVEVLLCLSDMAMKIPQIRELDINPLMAASDTCFAVDCRIILG